jgi:thiol-disulfide isomerase/thioredoxin
MTKESGLRRHWRRILREIVIALLILFVVSETISYFRRPELGSKQLPAIEVTLLDDSRFHVQDGKPLLLYFWGSWCPVCKLESPNIQRVSQHYEVLSFAVQSGNDAKLREYMQQKELSFRTVNDANGEWAKRFDVEVFPTILIYDGERELAFTEVGYTTTAGLLARLKMAE